MDFLYFIFVAAYVVQTASFPQFVMNVRRAQEALLRPPYDEAYDSEAYAPPEETVPAEEDVLQTPSITPRVRFHRHSARLRSRYKSNNCSTCWFHGEDAPMLFANQRFDGIGERVIQLTTIMQFAAKYGMNFGGLLPSRMRHPHGVEANSLIKDIFGAGYDQLFIDKYPKQAVGMTLSALTQALEDGTAPTGGEIVVKPSRAKQLDPWRGVNLDYSEEFLDALRGGSTLLRDDRLRFFAPVEFARPHLTVAIHVRRGDVHPGMKWRWASDEIYAELIDRVRRVLPQADMHLFSETGEAAPTSESFDIYRQRNVVVHLNGDVLEDWAHMARANVLIMAPSSFSAVPAIFNKGCVLYMRCEKEPQPSWIDLFKGERASEPENIIKDLDERLMTCLRSKGNHNDVEKQARISYDAAIRSRKANYGRSLVLRNESALGADTIDDVELNMSADDDQRSDEVMEQGANLSTFADDVVANASSLISEHDANVSSPVFSALESGMPYDTNISSLALQMVSAI